MLLAGAFAVTASMTPALAATNLLANPGFETGTLSGWSCSTIDSVTASPVHSGTHALQGAASSSDDAQCAQAVSVQPSSTYTLSGWVEGNYVFIGDTGSGTTDTDNWTPSAPTWQQLSTTFTTGAATTSVTIYVHGWYAQGTYFADDLTLSGAAGAGGGGTTVPSAPTGLTVTAKTSSSVSLSWTAATGATGYNVYENGTKALSATGTSATVSGLAASTTFTFAVTATNTAGESAKSASVSATTSAGTSPPPPPPSATFAVAPYVDLTNNQEPMVNSAASSAGLKAFTTAFVIGSGCTPIWGDTLPVTNDPTVTGEINTAEADGATPIVSFGGASGIELAQSCTNLTSLTAAYQSVINTLHVTHIDFDIEGAAIADTADNATRFQAIKALEAANPNLVVSVTIPVLPTGPIASGDAFLQQAQSTGARIDVINIMTMDYGASFDTAGSDMGSYAIEAAQDTLAFAKTVWPSDTFANIGVTPMIGINDDSSEDFTEADARSLVSFAQTNHLGRLAFWSVDRDQPCAGAATTLSQCSEISQASLDFTRIFTAFTG